MYWFQHNVCYLFFFLPPWNYNTSSIMLRSLHSYPVSGSSWCKIYGNWSFNKIQIFFCLTHSIINQNTWNSHIVNLSIKYVLYNFQSFLIIFGWIIELLKFYIFCIFCVIKSENFRITVWKFNIKFITWISIE